MGGRAAPIDECIEAFIYLLGFMATLAMSMNDTRVIDTLQRSQPLKVRLEVAAKQVRNFCLQRREVAAKQTLPRKLVLFPNEDVAD